MTKLLTTIRGGVLAPLLAGKFCPASRNACARQATGAPRPGKPQAARWAGFLAMLLAWFALPAAYGANPAGPLRIEISTAPNFVVDSNAGTPASESPRGAFICAKIWNDGTNDLTGVFAFVGNYTSNTPGLFPLSRSPVYPTIVGPSNGPAGPGYFAFTLQGGSAGLADATRFLGTIKAGNYTPVYWLVSYPILDVNGTPVFNAGPPYNDDLVLNYDVWATANQGVTPYAAVQNKTAAMRNEISAMANKIEPNTANQVPDQYKSLLQTYQPIWSNTVNVVTPGDLTETKGVWYNLGNVGQGYDIDNNLIPDQDVWLQPVGDPSLYDAGAFRLVRTFSTVIVKCKDGSEKVFTGQDQLYFNYLPDNTAVFGWVQYYFLSLNGVTTTHITPYQEAASGANNEKFNADFGSAGPASVALTTAPPQVFMSKTSSVPVITAGGTITYGINYTNGGTNAAGVPDLGMGLVVRDSIPAGTRYLAGTALNNNTLPAGVTNYSVIFSTNRGSTWLNSEPAAATNVTDIQWWLSNPLPTGAAGVVRFQVTVNNPYTNNSPYVTNTGYMAYGSAGPFAQSNATTMVLGNNYLNGTVFLDNGAGTGGYANGLLDGSEGGITSVQVSLYYDANQNGAIDSTDIFMGSTNCTGAGFYQFTNLFDGKYLALVNTLDPNLPTGATPTTVTLRSMDLDSARANTNVVSSVNNNFGFVPPFTLTKSLVGTSPVYEGYYVTNLIQLGNRLQGNGTSAGGAAQFLIWASASGTSGQPSKQWNNAGNITGAPDGAYATDPFNNAADELYAGGFSFPAQLGNIVDVRLVLVTHTNGGSFASASTTVSLLTNNVAAFSTVIALTNVGNSNFLVDVTGARSWKWSDFNGTTVSNTIIDAKASGMTATLDLDAVGYLVTTDNSVGGSSPTGTMVPVPLTDTYRADIFQFVSAVPPAVTNTVSGTNGVVYWSDVGPIYPGGTNTVSVVFLTLQPPNNAATNNVTDTAVSTNGTFLNGLPIGNATNSLSVAVNPSASIGDFIWRDLNSNGVQNVGEPGIPGVRVYLNIVGSTVTNTTYTDNNGFYLFSGLTNSITNYIVRVDTATLPTSWIQTYGPNGLVTTSRVDQVNPAGAGGSDNRLTNDFGFRFAQATIDGTVWNDLNRNGTANPDALEPYLSGVIVALVSNGVVVATTTNDASGYFRFTGNFTGSYTVVVSNTMGALNTTWMESYDTDGTATTNQVTVSVTTGGTANVKFSYYQSGALAIGDTVFYDWNGNASQDANDEGIANIPVYLYRDALSNGVFNPSVDPIIATNITSASGYYQFTNLPAGRYLVVVDEGNANFPSRFIMTYNPNETNGCLTCNNYASVNLTVSTNTIDFGYQPYGYGSIGTNAWFDANGNQIKSGSAETNVPNMQIVLQADLNGDGTYVTINTTNTSAAGNYLFANLPDGNYKVYVDLASAGLPRDAFGFNSVPTTPTNYLVSIVNGSASLTNNFGFMCKGAIGDLIFWDANGNGTRDPNEVGISNVIVKLYYDVNGNGVYNAGDVPVATNITDASGKYLFTNLVASNYVVYVDQEESAIIANTPLTADPDADGTPCTATNAVGCDGQYGMALRDGGIFLGADFGYQPMGVIGQTIWIDSNGNGVPDSNEPGLANVGVQLLNANSGVVVATNLTDFSGQYSFNGIPDGTYKLVVLTNSPGFVTGLTATYDPDGVPDSTINNIVISGGHVASVGGITVTNYDLQINEGYRFTGNNTLSGTIGLDGTNVVDGLMGTGISGVNTNQGEVPFVGASVYVYFWIDGNTNGVLDSGEATLLTSTQTDVRGDYSFTGLPASGGKYLVSMAPPYSNLKLTTTNGATVATSVVQTTNYLGDTLSVYQVVPIAPAVTNLDFAYKWNQPMDFGDLPDSYGTLLNSDGARHLIKNPKTLWLGTNAFSEQEGTPSVGANLAPDDDGITFLSTNLWREGGSGGSVRVAVNGSGWLLAWMDFNNNGSFADAGDLVINQAVSNGTYTNYFTIPTGGLSTTNPVNTVYTRFRLFATQPSTPELAFTGLADNGEVEDYRVTVGSSNSISGGVYLGASFGTSVGMGGVTVNLYKDANSNGVYDVGETSVASTATALNGTYQFTSIPNGNYVLVEINPTGATSVTDTAGANDDMIGVNLAGANSTGNNFLDNGVSLASVAGTVYWDTNRNSTLNTGEGITGVTVQLLNAQTNVAATTTTDASGNYSFAGMGPGTYTVRVVTNSLAAYLFPAVDPDGVLDNQNTFTLASGQAKTGENFGYWDSSIQGYVYSDLNHNGTNEAGIDVPLTNVTVRITATNGTIYNVVTDTNGFYSQRLAFGLAVVEVQTNTLPLTSSWTLTTNTFNDGVSPDTVLVPGGQTAVDNFGYQYISIAGRVVNDTTGSGAYTNSGTMAGITNVTVTLYTDPNGDGNPADGVRYAITTTDTNGAYVFTNLPAGNYVVVETNRATWVSTADVMPPNNDFIPVPMPAGYVGGRDFLDSTNAQLASLSGRVYNDTVGYGDLFQRAGLAGISNVTIVLYSDPNGDGDPSDGTLYDRTLTSTNGTYTFTNVPPGNYVVVETNLPGWYSVNDVTAPNDDMVSTVRVGTTPSINNDFMDSQAPHLGSIGDTVFWDVNGNNTFDTGEGLTGVQVFIDYNNNGTRDANEPQATTVANGFYTITNLPVGTYAVRVATNSLPSGFANTVDPDGGNDNKITVSLSAAQMVVTNADFGYTGPGSIGTTIYLDTNANFAFNPGEGISNIVVFADLNHNGARDFGEPYSLTAGTNGYYLITNLPAGTFDVRVDVNSLPANLVNTVDPDGTKNSQTLITLGVGQNSTNANWGYQPAAFISGTIYSDSNTNRVQDAAETGLPGILVGLYYTNGSPVLDLSSNAIQTYSDNLGFYQFSGVIAGSYLIKVDPANNTLPALSYNTQDPDGPTPLGNSQAITNVSVGGTITHMDFGYVVPKFLNKTVSPSTNANPGAVLTYTLKPFYGGNDLLSNVTVSDTIPDGTTYNGNPSPAAFSAPVLGGLGAITWSLGTNASGVAGTQYATNGGTADFGALAQIDNNTPANANSKVRMAIGADGTIHVVYNYNTQQTWYTKSTNNGASWWAPVNVSAVNWNADWNADVAVDTNNNVHVVYGTGGTAVRYAKFTVTGNPASPTLNTSIAAKTIDTGTPNAKNDLPRIVIGPNGVIHVAFMYLSSTMQTFYTKSTDGGTTWYNCVDITSLPDDLDQNVALAVDSSGAVHTVIDYNSTRIYYRKFTVTGTAGAPTFNSLIAAKTIDSGTGNRLPQIAIDSTSLAPQPIHVVYNKTGVAHTMYTTTTDTGTTWSTPLTITSGGGNNADTRADLAVDPCGKVHVAINNNNSEIWYAYSSNNVTANLTKSVRVDAGSADLYPAIGIGSNTVFMAFNGAANGHIYVSKAPLTPCEVATTNTIAGTSTLVSDGDTITITMSVTSPEAVNNIQPTGSPLATNAVGGVSVSGITAVDVAPKNISAGGSASFVWTATAIAGSTLPGSIAFANSAVGTSVPRGTPVHFNSALANSVLVSPLLSFQVAVNSPATVTEVRNSGTLRDNRILTNGVPSSLVITPLNVTLDFGDLPDYGTNGPGSYSTLLTNNGPRHIFSVGDIYIGTVPTDGETNAWQSANADGDNTHGANDENGVLFPQLAQGLAAILTITNVSGTNGVLNAWADWNHNGVFDSNERIFSNLVLVASITATNVTVNVPPSATLGATGFRFRVTDAVGQGGDAPTGLALSGEVEDYYPTVTAQIANVSGRVINDTNGVGDLTTRGAMPGITNVSVGLYTDPNGDGNPADGAWYATATTGANGSYVFSNVPPGNYVVVETNLIGWTSVNDVTWPNNDMVSVVRVGITASSGNDFLDSQTPHLGSIGDTVFWDKNANGLADAGEGISGVLVYIDLNGNSVADANEVQATTSASGYYNLTNLPAGTYTVKVATGTLPGGYANTVDPDAVLDSTATVTLTTSQMTNTTTDFGYQGTGSIGTTIFNDLNASGTFNAGEGLTNVVVYVDLNSNGVRDSGEPYATTSTNGTYLISNLPAGTYDVKVDLTTLAGNLVNTVDPDGTLNSQTAITLTAGQNNTTANWGYQARGSLSGTVYNDANTNSVQDVGSELGLSGITVGLYYTNGTAVLDGSSNPIRVTTDSYGFYQFTNLVATNYLVRVDPLGSTLPALSTNTQDPDAPPSNGQAITNIVAGATVVNFNFGYVLNNSFPKTVSPSTNANPGAILTYTLSPTYGNAMLTNVTVSDTIPMGAAYNGSPTPTPASAPAIGGGGTITWNLGTSSNAVGGIHNITNFGSVGTFAGAANVTNGTLNTLPKIVAGPDGTIHMVYINNLHLTYYTKSLDRGVTWWNATPITSTSTTNDRNASLAVDSQNNVHVVYGNGTTNVYYSKFTVTGSAAAPSLNTIIGAKPIARGVSSQLPKITVGADDSLHVVYTTNTTRAYYTKSIDSGTNWFNPVEITSTPGTPGDTNLALAVDISGNVHVVADNNGQRIYYSQFTVSGTTNSPVLNTIVAAKTIDAGSTGNLNHLPKIAIDRGALSPQPLYVVYNYNNQRTFYTKSTDSGATWSSGLDITASATVDRTPGINVDRAGNLHAVMGSSTREYYRFSTNATNWSTAVTVDAANSFNVDVATAGNTAFVAFDNANAILYNKTTLTNADLATTNSMTITPSLVTSNATVNISMTVSVSHPVTNLAAVTPVVTNAVGGANLTGITPVYTGPTNLSTAGTVTFTWTATAVSGTTLPSSVSIMGIATGSNGYGAAIVVTNARANSVLVSPPLRFQVAVSNAPTVTDVINYGTLRDGLVLSNGVQSTVVDTPLNLSVDFGDLPDYGTNGPGSFQTLLARNGARHLFSGASVYLGTTATDSETNAWQNPTATGDNTNNVNDENGVVIGQLVQGMPTTITITNVSGIAGVLNAWADWNNNGLFDANERIFSNTVLSAAITVTNLTINVPGNATLGATGFRFRVTNQTGQGGDTPTGLATTGEVEDYYPTVVAPALLNGRVYWDYNLNGTNEISDAGITNVQIQISNTLGTVYQLSTDVNGQYSQLVAPGTYTILVLTNSTNLSGLYLTTDINGEGHNPSTNSVAAGGTNTQNFGWNTPGATLAFLRSIHAYATTHGVMVRWETATEVGSQSFDLYRRTADNQDWVQVNTEPVLASNRVTGGIYQVYDSGASAGVPQAYRLVETEERGVRRELGPYQLTAVKGLPMPQAKRQLLASPAQIKAQALPAAASLVTPAEVGTAKLVKLVTTGAGMRAVSADTLAALFEQPADEVRQWIAQGSLGLTSQGHEVASIPANDGSALYFYAEAVKNIYTEQNVYWLAWRTNAAAATVDGQAPTARLNTLYEASVTMESDQIDAHTLPVAAGDDFWMWTELYALQLRNGTQSGTITNIPVSLDHLVPGENLPARVTLQLYGADANPHGVTVKWNGHVVGNGQWTGMTPCNVSFEVPSSYLTEGTNTLTVQASYVAGGTTLEKAYLNRLVFQYARQYYAQNGAVEFGVDGNNVVTVGGFGTPAIAVADITNPKQPVQVANLNIEPQGDGYRASFVPPNPYGRYAAWQANGAALATSAPLLVEPAGLSSATNQAEYLVITTEALASAANDLAAYRQSQGLTAKTVTMEQIYNEFGHGLTTPQALQHFLATAMANWAAPKPRYAVLVGKGTYDYRNLKNVGDNLVPPLMIETPEPGGLSWSDSMYGDVNGDGVPEIAIGRLPVVSTNELTNVLAKLRAYEALPAAMPPQALLIADQPDNGGDFDKGILAAAGVVSNKFTTQTMVCAAPDNYPAVRAALTQSWSAGVDLVSYLGHGAYDALGGIRMIDWEPTNMVYLTEADVPGLANGPRLPVVVAATCTAADFGNPGTRSLAEALVMQPAGGALAVVGPTTLSWNSDAERLNLRLVRALSENRLLPNGKAPRLGDATRRALSEYSRLDQPATPTAIYNLLGDPALLYRVPSEAAAMSAPNVALLAPTNAVTSGPDLVLGADAYSMVGTIQRVEYYENGVQVGVAYAYPFLAPLSGLAPGLHSFTAVAYDSYGNATTSIVQQVVVTAENLPPQIQWVSQLSAQVLDAPAEVTLQANASDADGSVTKVEFYLGNGLCGVVTNAPYALTLPGLPAGDYTFWAVATDNLQSQTSTQPVTLHVQPFRILSIDNDASHVVLQVAGGLPPYIVETKSSLDPKVPWTQVSVSTVGTNIVVPVDQLGSFYRVRSAQ